MFDIQQFFDQQCMVFHKFGVRPCHRKRTKIAMEYGMQQTDVGSMLKIQVRAAVAGYVLRLWNVDCSQNHVLDGPEVHLRLRNRQTLYGVENLSIAPGY